MPKKGSRWRGAQISASSGSRARCRAAAPGFPNTPTAFPSPTTFDAMSAALATVSKVPPHVACGAGVEDAPTGGAPPPGAGDGPAVCQYALIRGAPGELLGAVA